MHHGTQGRLEKATKVNIPEPSLSEQGPTARNVQEVGPTARNVQEKWLIDAVQAAAKRHQVLLPDAMAVTDELLGRLNQLVQDGSLTDPVQTLSRLRLFWAGVHAGAAMAGGDAA